MPVRQTGAAMRKIPTAILMLSLSAAVSAADRMKPGLWEMTIKSDAIKRMPKIPPEQIEQMRKMGIAIPQMQDGGIVQKVCISAEMAQREPALHMHQEETGCQSKNFQRTGDSYSADIVCDGPSLKGSFSGNESFVSTYDFKGAANGQPISQHTENSGRWLNADCGDVKPMDELMRQVPKK
jgi:hypothetical protein